MASQLLDFNKYETPDSKFTAELVESGGHINFSNSGKGGVKKHFTLSLQSFLTCLEDIKSNISKFKGHENYVEQEWRDLGSEHYSDGPANAQCTVQTKPQFVTLSKIIMWGSTPHLDKLDPESTINLDIQNINTTIEKLKKLIAEFTPKAKITTSESIKDSNKSIREFALYVFDFFFGKDWKEVIDNCKVKESKINEVEFESLDFESFNRLIAKFNSKQTKQHLTSSKTIRYFEQEIYTDETSFYYFTTQWNGTGEYSLSFKNLKSYFESKYPNYRLKYREGKYELIELLEVKEEQLDITKFKDSLKNAGLVFQDELITRFITSLVTKSFVLLTGLSGSGKTKLAQAFAQWICQDESQFAIVPVGADWTNREPLLGYTNALNQEEYIIPHSGVVDIIISANSNLEIPHFLILDEMNLSHVERYFADFLSVMESKDTFKLHDGTCTNVSSQLDWPPNLFVVGTVNIDETTYMFSPKVLDRANVIEFRISEKEIAQFLNAPSVVTAVNNDGTSMAASFVRMTENKEIESSEHLVETLNLFFKELQLVGAEFGYRTAIEIQILFSQLAKVNPDYSDKENKKTDIAIMQKLLPKLHGSRRKLDKVLTALGNLCYEGDVKKDYFENSSQLDFSIGKYPLSLEKITRMYKSLIENGFASYAEA